MMVALQTDGLVKRYGKLVATVSRSEYVSR